MIISSSPDTSGRLHRRGFLARAGTLGLVGLGLPVLASCAGKEPASSSSAGPLSDAKIQLGWIPNVESMAAIVATAKKYYQAAGTTVELLPGGPEVVADAQVVGGNAFMGLLSGEALANAVIAGAPLVAIGAQYQTASACIVSLASSGITEPKDLEGKRFGITQTDARTYTPFFRLAGVDASKVELVTTGGDPAALTSGEVDAISGVLANQPVAIAAQGIDVSTIRLADHGYNRWSGLLVVRKDSLTDPAKRATASALMNATTKAMKEAVADPAMAGQVVFDTYGEQLGLPLETQRAGAKVWAELASEGTESQGLLRVTEEGIAAQQDFFDTIGLKVKASDLYDLSLAGES